MNPRLLTSAVAIHATACVVAFFAVGPRQADASYDFLKNGNRLRAIPELDRSAEPDRARYQHVQKIAANDLIPSAVAQDNVWDEAKFNAQLEATSDVEDGALTAASTDSSSESASNASMAAEVVIAAPLIH